MKKLLLITVVILALLILGIVWKVAKHPSQTVTDKAATNFEECVAEGNPVMESYPRQCISKDGTHFTENVGNKLEKTDLIQLDTPHPNESIQSPLTITGRARGNWFFEGSFPIVLTDWDGKIIGEGYATAKGDWMTEDFVPFEATLTFTNGTSTYSNKGTLILKKDNPSGLPQNDDALEVPVIFEKNDTPRVACSADAKLCPDGSAVSRTGPNCEFAPCPSDVATGSSGGAGILPFDSGAEGTVLLGPTCPVMKTPPDPNCADKPFVTIVEVYAVGGPEGIPFATVNTDKEGKYKVILPPGEYSIQAQGGKPFPTCSPKTITIGPNAMQKLNLSCDTGIR